MKRNFFRDGDRVTVHNSSYCDGKAIRGRVVAANRKSLYGLAVVVLIDIGESEMVETFSQEGRRYMPDSNCNITLGWESEE